MMISLAGGLQHSLGPPLIAAAAAGHTPMVDLLLSYGGTGAPEEAAATALATALSQGHAQAAALIALRRATRAAQSQQQRSF